jgi:hypothetical protein
MELHELLNIDESDIRYSGTEIKSVRSIRFFHPENDSIWCASIWMSPRGMTLEVREFSVNPHQEVQPYLDAIAEAYRARELLEVMLYFAKTNEDTREMCIRWGLLCE